MTYATSNFAVILVPSFLQNTNFYIVPVQTDLCYIQCILYIIYRFSLTIIEKIHVLCACAYLCRGLESLHIHTYYNCIIKVKQVSALFFAIEGYEISPSDKVEELLNIIIGELNRDAR